MRYLIVMINGAAARENVQMLYTHKVGGANPSRPTIRVALEKSYIGKTLVVKN
jgi:hypothetical protein